MGLKSIASFDHIIADEQNSFEKKNTSDTWFIGFERISKL